ncbi:MAG TPA: ATP-binding protein [Terracidiphilus sp.]|nr:ATP-binding protein [Terracidiphilus sp.]
MRLFFKIFIIFWIAQSLIFVITTAFILSRRFPHPASMLDPAFRSLHYDASLALKAFDSQGCAGFNAFAKERNEILSLVDEHGTTVCGQTGLSTPAQVASAAEIYGRQMGNDTVWTFPVTSATGRAFRFLILVPAHHDNHTWYGDLLHFSFPQLPVAIAVGGLTTFVLVMIFTRPVVRLRKAARELARGKLSTRVKDADSRSPKGDEFEGLVHDFNHMAERLESLVNAHKLLLRDVSHELRSPLARANVALELSREDADPKMTSHLNRIERETERLNQLIGQLLTLSSMEAAESLDQPEKVSLKQLLGEMLPDSEYEAQQRGAAVELKAECECAVQGRRELLYRAIENVIRNAIRYTEAGTQVEVRLHQDSQAHAVMVEVSDRGPGIPESELDAIFRPFYRVDLARNAQTGGFGVGLAIAERAVKLHNGQIRALNRAGGGTTIQISLPITA